MDIVPEADDSLVENLWRELEGKNVETNSSNTPAERILIQNLEKSVAFF
jgi:hypothetical protein